MNSFVHVHNLYLRRSETFRLHVKECAASRGTITCITGPNGGGKSTLIEILAGLLQPDGGSVQINGSAQPQTLQMVRAKLGYIPDDEHWFIKELCAQEYFELLADVYRRAGIGINLVQSWKDLAKKLHFTALTIPIQELSHGNKKKVQIIAALMHNPPLIIVDEVRNGLDPIAIIATEKLLKSRAENGACIIAATHDLWWAERIADSVILLADGTVKAQLSVAQIQKEYSSLEAMFMELIEP